ncbi:MAG: dephospho-CoA kinase [Steroidobacteraceae bacterium]
MAARLRIGLTGGIASGKSTVAQRFSELGIPVIDADASSRCVVARGQPGLKAVVDRFGAGVLTAEGDLDRRALRDLIFADPQSRRDLEAILHPLIRVDMEQRAAAAVGPYLVMAIPLLVEGGSRDRIDRILVVDADEAMQLQRLVARDSVSPEQARAILAAQADRASRLKAADDVLVNSGTVRELREAVDRLHQQYLRLAEAMTHKK